MFLSKELVGKLERVDKERGSELDEVRFVEDEPVELEVELLSLLSPTPRLPALVPTAASRS